ncbi:MAG: aminoacyl-tRNA hydrolase [Chloroflexi bacterium]|nr:aminoacyl-tRNA hydrolase [Chloroflexota bacterium]
MFLIVGLGNPGEQYTKNRHNVGFQSVKFLADRHRLDFNEKQHKARIATGMIRGQRVVLAKPFTFMNDSGQSVSALVRWYKIDPASELLVIYDDLDMPFESLRLRANGSAGGQNGMKSIIQQLGTQNFPRLRVGIGRPPAGWDTKDYVLGNWSREQSEKLPALYGRVADAVETFLTDGLTLAMTRFNVNEQTEKKKRPAATPNADQPSPPKPNAADAIVEQ